MAENTSGSLDGRVIHVILDVMLTPPGHPVSWAELGDTDRAMEIGRGLVREAVAMIKTAGEAEGFAVQINAREVVF